jgi:hypothetical protein
MRKNRVILFLMLQIIKRFFTKSGEVKKVKGKVDGKMWAEKQLREMAKLGGKLVL